MKRAAPLILAAAIAGGGCGDDVQRPTLTPDEVLARLRMLPGVTAEEVPTTHAYFHYYVLHFTQPVDHDDPSAGTFQQEVSLLHRNEQAPVPMIVHTSGYWDYYLDDPVELTKLLGANQISIEHRYFGSSRPVPTDWTKLTIAQMAADEHEIIAALRSIYEGAFVSTGGSKGGMTAIFHRRFYPDDVVGTVAYVAPISFGAPDVRYPPYLETIGLATCRQAVRDVAVRMLVDHRDELVALAQSQPGHSYTRVEIGAAVEAAITSLEWTFWQYHGNDECGTVPLPGPDETAQTLFDFLTAVSPVGENDDDMLAMFEPYYYQSCTELGYPDYGAAYLRDFQHYTSVDYEHELPTLEPTYETEPMRNIDDFVEHLGERLVFIYGGWDPWTAGRFALGAAADSALYIQPMGTHTARIATLNLDDRDDALSKLQAWTGVAPQISKVRVAVAPPPPPRMPPVLARALHAQK